MDAADRFMRIRKKRQTIILQNHLVGNIEFAMDLVLEIENVYGNTYKNGSLQSLIPILRSCSHLCDGNLRDKFVELHNFTIKHYNLLRILNSV